MGLALVHFQKYWLLKPKSHFTQCLAIYLHKFLYPFQVLIGVVPLNSFKIAKTTRHESRFGISSFVYRSRRPFHPDRLYDDFLEPYFMLPYEEKGTTKYFISVSRINLTFVLNLQKKKKSLLTDLIFHTR